MQRDASNFVQEMLQSITEIEMFLENTKSVHDYTKDLKTKKAVERNLEIIGEACKKIPIVIKDKNPTIEWRKIAGLRDFISHGYFDIDDTVIWDIITNKLKILKTQLENLKL